MVRDVEVLIGNREADHVSIKPRGSYPEDCGVEFEVCCDGWSGRVLGWLFKGELGRFADEVRQLRLKLIGTAQLEPIEPNITLKLIGDGKGHVNVTGTAQNHFERHTKLAFEFAIDQTYLKKIADDLSDADRMLGKIQ